MSERLEALIRKLAGDVGELRGEIKAINKRVDAVNVNLAEGFGAIAEDMAHLRKLHTASVNAMTSAMKQLALDKSIEARVRRLEDAVFDPKH